MSLDNVKRACEKYYGEPEGSCDVLYSERGPSCIEDDQIIGKKVLLVRFLATAKVSTDYNNSQKCSDLHQRDLSSIYNKSRNAYSDSTSSIKRRKRIVCSSINSSVFPKSVSIADVIKAGKLVKPKEEYTTDIVLESFDINEKKWFKSDSKLFHVEKEHFAEGAFRYAFKAYTMENYVNKQYVIKKFKSSTWKNVAHSYGMSLEEHTRKQIQMHMAAQAITNRLKKRTKSLASFEQFFIYNNVYVANLANEPVTVEPFVPGNFKYINNDGVPVQNKVPLEKDLYAKAECLAHFSYQDSQERLLLVDLQGSDYTLYDPEIATSNDLEMDNERYFCSGNLNEMAIDNFFSQHKCNLYCKLLSLTEIEMESEEDKD